MESGRPILNPSSGSAGIGVRLCCMHAVELVFAIGWAAFWIYWLVAALSMKRGRVPWSRELRIRAVVVVLAIVLLRTGAFRDAGINSDPWRTGLGLFLFAVGLGFAIWARLHIGRNWGTPMSQKDEPELVTSGPVRPRPPSHLLWHSGGGCRHRRGAELVVAFRHCPGWDLFRLQRYCRGAQPHRGIPRHLSGVQALDQDAHTLHLRMDSVGNRPHESPPSLHQVPRSVRPVLVRRMVMCSLSPSRSRRAWGLVQYGGCTVRPGYPAPTEAGPRSGGGRRGKRPSPEAQPAAPPCR